MKSKKLLYAFAGLVFVGGLAFAFSSTDMFKGTFEFDFGGTGPSAASGIPTATMAPTSTGAATLFDLRWDSDLSYDETSNVLSASMCIDDGAGDPSYTEDVLVDYYVYNDGTGSAVQSGVYTVTDIHRDSSMSSGDCVNYDLFTVDEGQLDDSEFRVSIALRFSDDADSSNDGRGTDLSDSDVVSGTNLLVQNLDYSDTDDLLAVDMCYEGDEPDSSLRYHVELDYSGSSTIGTNFEVASWGTGDCYTMNYSDFVSTYEASGETEVSVSVDTLDVISVSDGDDLDDNVLLETVEFPESGESTGLNLELVDAYIDGTALYVEFSVVDSSEAMHDFYLTHSIEDQSNDVAFSMSGGQSMNGLVVSDLTSLYELDDSVRDGGDALMVVTLDIDDELEESNEEDNSLTIELNEELLDQLLVEEEIEVEEEEEETALEYDYEGVARRVLFEGYGLSEDEVEKELVELIEEAVVTEMSEQEFFDALSLIAEDALDARDAEEEAAEQKEEEERREEEERAADAAEEEMRMSEEEIDDLLRSIAEAYEGKQGLDEAMEELKKQAMDGEWSSGELEENARSKFESLEEEEEEDRGEDKRDEAAVTEDEEEAIEVAVDSIDLGSGKRGLTSEEEERLEEALEEAVAEGSIAEEDLEAVVEDFESETDEDDDLTAMLAALDAAIAAANSAANSASSAASAASSAAHSASNSGGSSSGAQDVVVNIDLGDYVSDTQSSTATTGDTSSSSEETSTEVASDSPFSDVEEGTWYGDAMIALNEAGIMEGSNGKAYPWEYGNRAELVVLVMRAFYDESVLSKMDFDHEFEDVSATKWYAMYLSAAVDFDILEAKDEFRPSAPMTRAEFVTVLVRAANQVCMSCEADFSDIDQGDWYYRAVATALSADLVSGYEDGSFKPNSNINRAQVASILYKALEAGWLD